MVSCSDQAVADGGDGDPDISGLGGCEGDDTSEKLKEFVFVFVFGNFSSTTKSTTKSPKSTEQSTEAGRRKSPFNSKR